MAGNEGFSALVGRTDGSLRDAPLTLFELVDHAALQSLYGMLALGLHGAGVVAEDLVSAPSREDERQEREAVAEEWGGEPERTRASSPFVESDAFSKSALVMSASEK